MTEPDLLAYVATLAPELRAIFEQVYPYMRHHHDTSSDDFQIAAAIVRAFEEQLERHMDAEIDGEWCAPTDDEKRACQAVLEYEHRSEQFDRLLCGPAGVPKSGGQSSLVNMHAKELRDALIAKHGITPDLFQKALRLLPRDR